MHLAKFNVDLYYTRKRERREIKKRAWETEKRLSRARAAEYRTTRAGVFGTTSTIARMLSEEAKETLPMAQTSLAVIVPRVFSMLEAPDDAIKLVTSFARTHETRTISDVFVDLEAIQVQDLGAHALLDKLVEEIANQATFHNNRIGWRGTFPRDQGRRRFVSAMGIIGQLGLTNRYLRFDDAEKIHLFERRCRHYVREMKPRNPEDKSEQANAAERFANHVNRCLQREGCELTPIGRSQLCSYVVEVIDNAENHAGMVDWTIQGYVDMALAEPQCEIVVFNFGKSISETLDELGPESYTMRQIAEFLELHSKSGFFGPRWRREDLLTLVALQGSVSSKNISEDTTRGQGTADLIEFFQAMNDERRVEGNGPATMYIVSGGTRILFDPKYRMQRRDSGSRVIAFNSENDLRLPPDPECVMPLVGCRLPGTMIGVKFAVRATTTQLTSQLESAS